MFEFVKLGKNTYCYIMPTNVGFYVTDENEVYVIDTGVNEKSAKRILEVLEKHSWSIKAIILTHAHTDHAGGCKYLVEATGCTAYATSAERVFVEHPDLEPAVVYGAYPCRDFRGKFMNTPACKVSDIKELNLPVGFELIRLPGHFADMIGVKTPDDVYFLADAVISDKTLESCPMSYIFDLQSQYETLEEIKRYEGKLCVPSHAEPTWEIASLASFNKESLDKVNEIILSLLEKPVSVEDLVSELMNLWDLPETYMQYVMTSSGVRGHLVYLRHNSLVEYEVSKGRMYWKKV